MIRSLILFFFLSQSAWGVEIVFPNKGFSLEELVKFFWRNIPLSQLVMDPSTATAHVHGKIELSLHRLPSKMRDDLKSRIERVLHGEEPVAGVKLEVSQAEISYSGEGRIRRDEKLYAAEPDPEPVIDVSSASLYTGVGRDCGFLLKD